MESRARCAGFSVTEIGNRKERLRVREAGASAAGRGQRPYASFPDQRPNRSPRVVHTFVDNFVGYFGDFQEFSTAQNPVDNSVFGTYPSCQPTYDFFC